MGWVVKHCQRHNRPEDWVQLTKVNQLQNLNASINIWLNIKFIIFTKPSFRISTKVKLHNLNQAPAEKYWPNFSFIILLKIWLDQTLCSKSEQKNNLMTKLQLPNLHQIQLPNLHQIVVNMSLSINISNSNHLNKFWVGIFKCQSHRNQVYSTGMSDWVSELVSECIS